MVRVLVKLSTKHSTSEFLACCSTLVVIHLYYRYVDPKVGTGISGLSVFLRDGQGLAQHYGVLREWGGLTGRPRLKTCITTKCASLCVCVCVRKDRGLDRVLPPAPWLCVSVTG